MVVRPDDYGGHPTAKYELSVRCTSECIGTFVLVLTVLLNLLAQPASPAGAWSIAASLMCMIYALGNCSGAHFNPAVTLAIFCTGRGKVSSGDALAYVPSQILGGVLAAYVAAGMHHGETVPLGPKAPYSWGVALTGE